MYMPIAYADSSSVDREAAETPQDTMQRTEVLQESYSELKVDLLEEVNSVDARLIKPTMEARDHIQPLKKVIKKRQDKKLDFEKYQHRVDNHRKKVRRSDRDNAYLAKAEQELEKAIDEYHVADDQLKSGLPPVIQAAFSILPHLLAAQILIQNNLLGHYYTALHEYCTDAGFPSPPPPASEIIGTFQSHFRPTLRVVEALGILSNGRVSRQSFSSETSAPRAITNGSASRNGYPRQASSSLSVATSSSLRPPSTHSIENNNSRDPSPEPSSRPKISSIPSQTSLSLATPNYGSSASESESMAMAPAGPRPDYFSRDRQPSSSSMASIASKKKPPPPPPPPKRNFSQQGTWVAAIYDFAGQSHGDLAFKEGDRIRVLKKTDSTDDWWEGELQGIKGSFPANYCQAI